MSVPSDAGSYLICATPRTGSTLLCGLLESTGVAGHPQSYFRRQNRDEYADAWGIARPAAGGIDPAFLRAAVAAGSTSNGVFAARVMRETMPEVTGALAPVSDGPPRSDVELLTGAFGRLGFVHLRRRDVVAQAVSWARAEQSHFWHPGDPVAPGGVSPHFDRALIDELARRIERFEQEWSSWFAGQSVIPYEVAYEDLAADPVGVAQGVLDFLGLQVPPGRSIEVRHRRQADDLNADWIARFRT